MTNEQSKLTAILVDDDPSVRESLAQWIELADINVQTFSNAKQALAEMDIENTGVIISDVQMPDMDGLSFLNAAPENIPFVLITGHGGIAMAVDAMKAGAYDFIEKPFKPDRLIDMIHSAFSQKRSQTTYEAHQQNLDSAEGLATEIIGISESIQTLRAHVTALANVNADVVIHGETGTGKELVAKCLHNLSVRNNKPFIPINVSAIPENLIESELFGYEAGSFTGASKAHMGKFEFADGGTLLLDEIESMPMYFQVKLLRVLQEREVVRIGSHKAKRINVRLIAATKKNLKHAAEAGEFREDLYYRLLVSEIRIPPLRERKEDISLLFHHFLNEASKLNQLEAPVVTTQDEMVLNMHNWPGNVRELKNTAERYLLTHSMNGIKLKELIQVSDQSDSLLNTEGSLNERLELVEKMVLEAELRHHNGNIKAVMEVLNLPRRTLNQKMAKYGIKREAFVSS